MFHVYAVAVLCSRTFFLFFLLSTGKDTRRHPDMADFGFLGRKNELVQISLHSKYTQYPDCLRP